MVKHSVTVKGDRAATFRLLTDFAKYLEWYPECEKISVISSTGSQTDVDLTLGGMKVARMTLRYDAQPDLITYNMVSSQDLKGFTGSYKIGPDNGGSHVVAMEVDLTASVPKFVTDRMMKGSLEKQGKQLQDRNARYASAAAATPATSSETAPAEAAALAASPRAEAPRAKRSRCLLRIRKKGDGVSIWYAGSEFSKAK